MNNKQQSVLSQDIAEKIIQLIHEKSLNPGDKIPNELDLSTQIGVSRSTIREAIKLLTSKNILEVRRGIGTFVSSTPGFIANPWGLDFVQDKLETAMQLIDLRLIMEPAFARLAAEIGTEAEIEKIQKNCKLTEDAIFAGRPHYDEDAAFHTAIAEATHNTVAIVILKQIFNQSIPMQTELSNNSLLKETIITHSEVASSIAERDGQKAYDTMYRHLEYNKKLLSQLMDRS